MAFTILRICTESTNLLKSYSSANNVFLRQSSREPFNLLKTYAQPTIPTRNTSFFNKLPADALWKSATSVSNAGRRRGRARTLIRRKDLNKGQLLGTGKIQMIYPGLTAPPVRGSVPVKQQPMPKPKEEEETPKAQVDVVPKRKRVMRQHPLVRGWTSHKPGGRNIGAPESNIPGEVFHDDFDSWVLESKFLASMTGNLGRKNIFSAFVVTGNENGVAGFAVGKSTDPRKAQSVAKNKAGRRLLYIKRENEHTVLHDLYGQLGTTKVFIKKMYKGYGLVCHRALALCCKALGIKDIYIKAEGARNTQNLVKAFFIALLKQRTFQQIADETKLHVVELKPEQGYYPNVVASPAEVKVKKSPNDDDMDFKHYIFDGKVVLERPRKVPFYEKLPSWQMHLKRQERIRDHDKVKIRVLSEYGKLHSFLTKKYSAMYRDYKNSKKEE